MNIAGNRFLFNKLFTRSTRFLKTSIMNPANIFCGLPLNVHGNVNDTIFFQQPLPGKSIPCCTQFLFSTAYGDILF